MTLPKILILEILLLSINLYWRYLKSNDSNTRKIKSSEMLNRAIL